MEDNRQSNDRNVSLRDYFNKKCFGSFGPAYPAILGAVTSAVLLGANSKPLITLGVVMACFTAGNINRWQKAATGRNLWTPKLGKFGFGL